VLKYLRATPRTVAEDYDPELSSSPYATLIPDLQAAVPPGTHPLQTTTLHTRFLRSSIVVLRRFVVLSP
jgi:hypothetical protein